MKIKTSVNREYTTISQMPQVKADLKEFTEIFTTGDLVRMFWDAAERDNVKKITQFRNLSAMSGDCITCTVEGCPGGTDFSNKTVYRVDATIEFYDCFVKIGYYIDPDYTPGKMIQYPFGQTLEMFTFNVYKLQ